MPKVKPPHNSTLSLYSLVHGPCELNSQDGNFGPVELTYDDALRVWSDFYSEFLALADAADGSGAGVLIMRYEDIMRDERAALAAIASRAPCSLGVRYAPLAASGAAQTSLVPSYTGPQAKEKKALTAHGHTEEQLQQAWRRELPAEALHAACARLDARVMARLRYSCALDKRDADAVAALQQSPQQSPPASAPGASHVDATVVEPANGGGLLVKVRAIRAALSLDADEHRIRDVVTEANGLMGMPSAGPLPAQVDALMAALGI